jgi:hypothetical protein
VRLVVFKKTIIIVEQVDIDAACAPGFLPPRHIAVSDRVQVPLFTRT